MEAREAHARIMLAADETVLKDATQDVGMQALDEGSVVSEESPAAKRQRVELSSHDVMDAISKLGNPEGSTPAILQSFLKKQHPDIQRKDVQQCLKAAVDAGTIIVPSPGNYRLARTELRALQMTALGNSFRDSNGDCLHSTWLEKLPFKKLGSGTTSTTEIAAMEGVFRDSLPLSGDSRFVVRKTMKTQASQKQTWNASGPGYAFSREVDVLSVLLGEVGFPQLIAANHSSRQMYMTYVGHPLGIKNTTRHFHLPDDFEEQLRARVGQLAARGVCSRDFSGNNVCIDSDRQLVSLIDFGAAVLPAKHTLFTVRLNNAAKTSEEEMINLLIEKMKDTEISKLCRICERRGACSHAASTLPSPGSGTSISVTTDIAASAIPIASTSTSSNAYALPPHFIETGGKKSGSKPPSSCFGPGGNGLILDADNGVPNPYKAIGSGNLATDPTSIEAWILREKDGKYSAKWGALVNQGVQALSACRPVRVACFGGKHRSVALAHAIAREAAFDDVVLSHKDA